MSILSALIDASLIQEASVVWVDSVAVVSVGQLERRLFASRPPTAFNTTEYIGWGVRTRDNAESKIRKIVFKCVDGTRKTIGCIFPISSLDPDSEYCADRLDSSSEKAFASQAASLLVDRGIANEFVRLSFIDLPDESKLSDLFDPSMSVVVIGTPLMLQAGANEHLLQLTLQKFGYFVSPPKEQDDFCQFVSRDMGNINIEEVSAQAVPFIPELIKLIAVASRQSSPAAAFLSYYQAIEIFSQERFKCEVMRITQDAGILADAWLLRDKLTEAAGEKRRLNALISCCSTVDSASVNLMCAIGRRVLKSAGQDGDVVDKMSASEVLYKIRNLVVHDQKAMPPNCYSDFVDFVYSVHHIIFALISSFDAALGHVAALAAFPVGNVIPALTPEANGSHRPQAGEIGGSRRAFIFGKFISWLRVFLAKRTGKK